MIFGAKTEEQKKLKELNRECKELRKELLAAKLDRKQIDTQIREFREALTLGSELCHSYVDAQEHFALARRGVMDLMDTMGQIPNEQVMKDLEELNTHLTRLYHECDTGLPPACSPPWPRASSREPASQPWRWPPARSGRPGT